MQWKQCPLPGQFDLAPTSLRCQKPVHKTPDIPIQFDVRAMTIGDLETLLEDKYTQLDAIPTYKSQRETEESSDQLDFTDDNE